MTSGHDNNHSPEIRALPGWRILLRSMWISLVVGTFLVAVNQGDLLLDGRAAPDLYWKIPLTYLTPFLVATVSAVLSAAPRQGNAG